MSDPLGSPLDALPPKPSAGMLFIPEGASVMWKARAEATEAVAREAIRQRDELIAFGFNASDNETVRADYNASLARIARREQADD